MSDRRVVITGIGVISPVGMETATFWRNLTQGVNGITRFDAFDSTDYDCKIAGEIKDFTPAAYFKNPKSAKRTDRFTQFAMAAAKMAVEDSGLDPATVDLTRV